MASDVTVLVVFFTGIVTGVIMLAALAVSREDRRYGLVAQAARARGGLTAPRVLEASRRLTSLAHSRHAMDPGAD